MARVALDGRKGWRPTLRVVAAYVLVLSLWIAFSDTLVARLASDADQVTRLQTAKGFAFVMASGGLLFLLIHRTIASLQSAAGETEAREERLELILGQVPANIWTTDLDLRIDSIEGREISIERPHSDLVGRTIREILGEDASAPALRAHAAALEGSETTYRTEWEGLILDSVVGPLRDGEGKIVGCLGCALDITGHVQSERERLQTLARLQRVNEERLVLLRRLVRAEEDERRRIAMGIHDDSIQIMTAAGMALDMLNEHLKDPNELQLAKRSRELIRGAISRLRTLAFELRPAELDDSGLVPAVQALLERAGGQAGFEHSISDTSTNALGRESRYIAFQILREAITNIVKHAAARHVSVHVSDRHEGVVVVLRDDGRGFDPGAVEHPRHFGLSDMRERAVLIGGNLSIESRPGEGSLLELWLPSDLTAGGSEAS